MFIKLSKEAIFHSIYAPKDSEQIHLISFHKEKTVDFNFYCENDPDDFYENFCEDCHRLRDERERPDRADYINDDESDDDYGEIDDDRYEDDLDNWYESTCPGGYSAYEDDECTEVGEGDLERNLDSITLDIPPHLFITKVDKNTQEVINHYLAYIVFDELNEGIEAVNTLKLPNIYDDGQICWGEDNEDSISFNRVDQLYKCFWLSSGNSDLINTSNIYSYLYSWEDNYENYGAECDCHYYNLVDTDTHTLKGTPQELDAPVYGWLFNPGDTKGFFVYKSEYPLVGALGIDLGTRLFSVDSVNKTYYAYNLDSNYEDNCNEIYDDRIIGFLVNNVIVSNYPEKAES